ncbi:MAG: hypothetical protein M1812_007390 [Candelaria pacifica]|nr:MAG: hypothetical protein M1812_007390 [Candelaria pacifica]
MLSSTLTTLAVFGCAMLSSVNGYPHLQKLAESFEKSNVGRRAFGLETRQTTWSPSQLIDVTGDHAFRAPKAGDSRGPCPAQNAMANHGYLDHSGYTTLEQCIQANVNVFNFSPDFSLFLCFLGQLYSSNLVGPTWAIGNSSTFDSTIATSCPPATGVVGVLGPVINPLTCKVLNPILNRTVGAGYGLAQSHLNFEGDASLGQFDWGFLNGADASSLHLPYFQQLWNDALPDGTFDDLSIFTRHHARRFEESVQTNPCFFNAPFAGAIAAPAAHAFVYRIFSNHSAERPDGTLTKEVLASFFGVEIQKDGSLKTKPFGHEQIPENWYKRPTPYSLAQFMTTDFVSLIEADPRTISMGGNTGGPNTFTGIDIGDLSGGVYNSKNILDGQNFACFQYRLVQEATNSQLNNPAGERLLSLGSTLGQAIDNVYGQLTGPKGTAGCPTANIKDLGTYSQFCGINRQKGTTT